MTSEEGKCKKCFKMIPLNKKYVKLNDNSSYHCHCFCCKICKNQIPADMYIEEKGFFYHKKCYLNLLHPKCNKCFKKLTGKIIKISEIEMYHKKCFHCVRCDIQIIGKFMKVDNLPCCKRCFSQIVTFCGACRKPIKGKRYKSKDLTSFHPECFVCTICDEAIGNKPFTNDGNRLFHLSCYKQVHALRCDRCREILNGDYVQSTNGNFHYECFESEFSKREQEKKRMREIFEQFKA